MDIDMDLYLWKVDDEIWYPPCKKCQGDMSIFASPTHIRMICNLCHEEILDDEANDYAMGLIKGKKNVQRKKVQDDGYRSVTDFFPA